MVDTEGENYAQFVRDINAPSGVLVSKPLYQVFSDPDGDKLTYAATITSGNSHLVEELDLRLPDDPNRPKITSVGIFPRLFLTAGDDADWKAISPALADPARVTVRVTVTDTSGLSASVEGDYLVQWDSYPEVVSAEASGKAIEVTFDVAVEDDPAPTASQFTVNVANADGTDGTIAVNDVSVKDKVVTLTLAAEPQPGQTVTLDYAHDKDAPLKRAADGGDHSRGFTGLAVELPAPAPVVGLRLAPSQRARRLGHHHHRVLESPGRRHLPEPALAAERRQLRAVEHPQSPRRPGQRRHR